MFGIAVSLIAPCITSQDSMTCGLDDNSHIASFLVCAGGKVEWGHLAAGDAALNAALHQDGQQYDMIGEEVEALVPASAQGAGPSMGRGRDAVKPAWMTDNGAAAAPGSAGMPVMN